MRYYKNKHDAQENGSVNLALSNWVRPYDLSPDCKTFEVHSDADRTFVFEAADAKVSFAYFLAVLYFGLNRRLLNRRAKFGWRVLKWSVELVKLSKLQLFRLKL